MKPPVEKSLSESLLDETIKSTGEDFFLHELYEEIEMISDLRIKSFVRACLLKTDCFWVSAASLEDSHPPDERVEGGMILHTQRVLRTAMLLAQTVELSNVNLDILIAACLLHDITKAVWRDEERTEILHDTMHVYTIDAYVAWVFKQDKSNTEDGKSSSLDCPSEIVDQILRLIRCSHGAWSPIPETQPVSIMEKILHMADLTATNLHILLDGTDIIEERWMQ